MDRSTKFGTVVRVDFGRNVMVACDEAMDRLDTEAHEDSDVGLLQRHLTVNG